MSIKTISLELDAYEKLKQAKRGKESFSQVVRRARFDPPEHTGEAIVQELRALYQAGKGASEKALDELEKRFNERRDTPNPSPSPWDESSAAP